MNKEPLIGDFGVSKSNSLLSWVIRIGTWSSASHAFVYVGDGLVLEAMPTGARLSPVENCSNPVWAEGRYIPDIDTGEEIAHQARKLVGTPYGWTDILAILLAQLHLFDRTKPESAQPWYIRRTMSTNALICSELVDYAYYLAGVHLFDDGRCPGLVTPGDLARLIR